MKDFTAYVMIDGQEVEFSITRDVLDAKGRDILDMMALQHPDVKLYLSNINRGRLTLEVKEEDKLKVFKITEEKK